MTETGYRIQGATGEWEVVIGLEVHAQVVSQAKTQGTLEYMRSLPVPRMVYLLADLTVWIGIIPITKSFTSCVNPARLRLLLVAMTSSPCFIRSTVSTMLRRTSPLIFWM